ncbi:flagellar filament capping protein FliD [Anaerotignum sp.]|uniref:flagellar filament capping protein FliD n=1 Tax=Anaerotignum sp. TaxID=2039241 RepID=UPI003320470A
MATISSLTSSSSSSNAYGSQTKGIGGLVSGLNTDEIIDGMTISTRSKIAKQKQNKTLLSWKTDAYRSISSKLISFADKYTSYSSNTNLYSDSFYGKTVITPKGENSKYVSVSGNSTNSQISILGIKQLAKDASFTTSESLSNNYIQSDAINYGTENTCTLAGKSFTVEYGSEKYTVKMPQNEGGVYTNAAEVAAAITKALDDVEMKDGKKLSTVMSVTADGETLNFKNTDGVGNRLKIVGGDASFLKAVGITSDSTSIVDTSISDTGTSAAVSINPTDLQKVTTFVERVKDKSLTFEYNGVKKTITFSDESKLNDTDFVDYLGKEIDAAFGQGRIKLSKDAAGKIQFQPVLPNGNEDKSSILKISSSSDGLLGNGSVFGFRNGSTNKLNLSSPLEDAGIKNSDIVTLDDGREYELRINGESIKFTYEKGKTSLGDIISAINNNEKAGVQISYQSNSDSFSIISTHKGASGNVEIGDASDPAGKLNDLEKLLFGKRTITAEGTPEIKDEVNGTTVQGQDAVILVDFDGAGGSNPMEITRGTNSFTLDGMTIGASGTFGFDESGNPVAGTEEVTFNASIDTDKVFNAIKSMINDYNELVSLSNSAVKEKRDRNYAPLTDEQKKEMSETEIKNWEEKAKAGLLFGDSEVINLTNDLRFAFLNTRSDGLSFSDIGITVSTEWSDNGKINLDESKLKSALQDNSDNVKILFTDDPEGNSLTSGGVMARMKAVTDKYAATTGATKGILVEKAGNEKSPSSILKNSLLDQMNDIDDMVERLEAKLSTERTRYQKKFTALEQLVQQMNTQSGWLSQQFGS